jgi:glycosyltransferase involved in cell wall biosynthesis
MRVLHLVAGQLAGGAARGAYWLHLGLRELGVDSKILTNSWNTLGGDDVLTVAKHKMGKIGIVVRRALESLPVQLYVQRQSGIFSSGFWGFDFTKTAQYREADVVHLHWINDGFVNMRHLRKIDKPVVWTMRDMWPMTGGCHYSMGCENYLNGCGHCQQLNSKTRFDLSRLVLARKRKYVPKHIKLVGISHWLSQKARESSLFCDADIRMIHNNVNTQEFFPVAKRTAREILAMDTAKRIVLCGGADTQSGYKGFDKFWEAINLLDSRKYMLLCFGDLLDNMAGKWGFEYRNVGYVNDNIVLRLLYSASDVFVAPSLMEAFGKTLVEAMACGTPVVCFDATGPKDIVTHKLDGYKAKAFDSRDLANGIEWICANKNYDGLSQKAREKVVRVFDSVVIARQYIELYEEMTSVFRES